MESVTIIINYINKPRELKKRITIMLKKGLAINIKRINYVKSYYLLDGVVKQNEEKILIITSALETKDKLIDFINNTHPNKNCMLLEIK